MSTPRRKYKAEALAWKRAALDAYGTLSQIHFGLMSYGHVPEAERIRTVVSIIEASQKRFEAEHPPEDEAGWSRVRV